MTFENYTKEEIQLWIGKKLYEQTIGNKPTDEDTLKEISKNWYLSILKKNKEKFCGSKKLKSLLGTSKKKDFTVILATLTDMLGSSLGLVPIGAFSVMVIHFGYSFICE